MNERNYIVNRRGWKATNQEVKVMLGLRSTDKLPPEGMEPREIQGITVYVRSLRMARKIHPRTPRSHRVRAYCPVCGVDHGCFSLGRLHQHVKVHEQEK